MKRKELWEDHLYFYSWKNTYLQSVSVIYTKVSPVVSEKNAPTIFLVV